MDERIGQYRVEGEIGRGGMGVVYRAIDERLDRDVAIKALPEDLAGDPARLERFEREAKAIASINHPNIAAIYGVEEQHGTKYLILEFVEGETLGDRLDRGPLEVDDAVDIAVQIAEGVEAAHEAGIIHRDLKPANIKITPDGKVKVLDFGLAKADEGAASSTGMSQNPTITTPAVHSPTMAGVILGTAAYMSPEQARGRRVDKRTDIWSFGVILFEMLVGASPFVGETVSDSIGAVLHKTIELERLPGDTPEGVKRVLARCVERDKNQRYRDIGDVRLELLRAIDEPAVVAAPAAVGLRPLLAVMLIIAVLGAVGWFSALTNKGEVSREVRKFDLMQGFGDQPLEAKRPQISPDGRRVAFLRDDLVHIRDLSSFESRPLPGTDGAISIFWSPDSKWVCYLTNDAVYKLALLSGGVTKVADAEGTILGFGGGGWTNDDRIIFREEEYLAQVAARGGEPTPFIEVDDTLSVDFHDSVVINGTNVVLYINHRHNAVWELLATDGQRHVVVAVGEDDALSTPAYSPTGHILFVRGYRPHNLWAIGFDPNSMEITSEQFLVLPDASRPSVSSDGTLSVMRGAAAYSGQIVWAGLDGTIEPIGDRLDLVWAPVLSPDGTKIAVTTGSPGKFDIWLLDLARGSKSRITFNESWAFTVAWSLDSKELAIITFNPSSNEIPTTSFYAADGSGQTRPSIDTGIMSLDAEWTVGAGGDDPMSRNPDVYAIPLDDPDEQSVILSSEHVQGMVMLNPAGTLMAYVSRESGDPQVYCTRFPDGKGKWQVSTQGGSDPRWSSDGATLYFENSSEKKIYAVDVTTDPSIRFGMPRVVLDAGAMGLDLSAGWSVSGDGQRFVMLQDDTDDQEKSSVSIIENWFEEYRGR